MNSPSRLLILSHAGVLAVNRAPFQALAAQTRTKITLVVPKQWKGDLITDLSFKRVPQDASLEVIALPVAFSGNGSLFTYPSGLREVFHTFKPDFVLIDEEPWSLAAAQAAYYAQRAPLAFFTKQNLKKRLPPPFGLLQSWVFSRSERAFAISQEVEEVLRWKGFVKEIQPLYHSFDPALFQPLASSRRDALRGEWGIPSGRLVITYLGRITEEKGIRHWLDACDLLDPALPLFFLCVGNGPLAELVQHRFTKLGKNRAKWLPALPHDEIGVAYALSDVVVLPSCTTPKWKEQYGRVIVESLACGTPVIGSSSGEIPILVERTGGGVIYPEGDAVALARALTKLSESAQERGRLAQAGRAYVHAQLTHDAVAGDLARRLNLQVAR